MFKLKGLKKIVLMIIPVFMLVMLNGLAGPYDIYSQESRTGDISIMGGVEAAYGYTSIRDNIEFSFDTEKFVFQVRDRRDGTIWKSYVEAGDIQTDRILNQKWLDTMSSLIVIQYTNYSARGSTPSSDESVVKTCYVVDDMVLVKMDFTDEDIRLEMFLWVENNALQVLIPGESIEEYGDYGVMQIDILPFFMSSQKYDSGYMFYPDGCGALYYFKGELLPNASKRYTFNVYSKPVEKLGPDDYKETNDELTSDLMSKMLSYLTGDAALPAFGIKKDKSAMLAVIMDGDSDASISVEPCGYALDVNRMFPSILYRYTYKDPRDNVAKMVTYYEPNMTSVHDAHIQYIFLSKGNADYVGMANAYRSVLLEETDIVPHSGNISGALSLFCGITKSSILFDNYIASVKFEHIQYMMDDIGIGGLLLNLVGSNANGYNSYNIKYEPAESLGGSSGYTEMLQYAGSLGNKVYIEENFLEVFAETQKAISMRSMYIRDSNDILITDNYAKEYLVNPLDAFEIFSGRYIESVKEYYPDGITFRRLGELIYRDRAGKKTTSFGACIDAWESIIESAEENVGGSAVEGGNLYSVRQADWLYDIPMKDSGCALNDESVPFYQIALHGLIDYSGQPGNLTYDYSYTRLKWAEYGCVPFFELTYENAEKIMTTSYNQLYSSTYSLWADTVKQAFTEYTEELCLVSKSFIIDHEKVSDDIVKVTYSNGYVIYLNYGDTDWENEEAYVPASDYTMIRPGG